MKTFTIFCVSLLFIFSVYSDSLLERICAELIKEEDTLVYQQEQFTGKPISGRGYLIKIEKDAFGTTHLYLSNLANKRDPQAIQIILTLKEECIKEALKYRENEYVYFSGKIKAISKIYRQIFVKEAKVSRFREVIYK